MYGVAALSTPPVAIPEPARWPVAHARLPRIGRPSRELIVETLASIGAAMIMALMVAAAGAAMAHSAGDPMADHEIAPLERPDPLTICLVVQGHSQCVREET